MPLPDYRPPFYQRLRAGGVPNAYTSVPFDKEAFVGACLQSETSSVTIDLSSEKKIRLFADQLKAFHPVLLDAVAKWVNDTDKERARDCVHISGWLPGQTPKTASQEMWDKGFTFMDVISEAQRQNLNPLSNSHDEPFLSVSYALPDQRGVFVRPKPVEAGLGAFGKAINGLSGGILKNLAEKKQKLRMQKVLSRVPADDIRERNREQNRNVLRAEQAVREVNECLSDYTLAQKLTGELLQERERRVERDRELYEPVNELIEQTERRIGRLMRADAEDIDINKLSSGEKAPSDLKDAYSANGTNRRMTRDEQIKQLKQQREQYLSERDSGAYDEVDIHGSIVRVDCSQEAQTLRRIELEETREVMRQLQISGSNFAAFAQQSTEQLALLRLGGECDESKLLPNYEPDDMTAGIIKASRSTEPPDETPQDTGPFKALIAERDKYEQALKQKQRFAEYIKFSQTYNKLTVQAESAGAGCIENVAQLCSLVNNTVVLNRELLEYGEQKQLEQTLRSLSNISEAPQPQKEAAALTRQLNGIVKAMCDRDDETAVWQRSPEQSHTAIEQNAEKTHRAYSEQLAADRPKLHNSIICSVADRAVTANRMQLVTRERITPEMLGIEHEKFEKQTVAPHEINAKSHTDDKTLKSGERK